MGAAICQAEFVEVFFGVERIAGERFENDGPGPEGEDDGAAETDRKEGGGEVVDAPGAQSARRWEPGGGRLKGVRAKGGTAGEWGRRRCIGRQDEAPCGEPLRRRSGWVACSRETGQPAARGFVRAG